MSGPRPLAIHRWRTTHHHDHQVAAARRTLVHLQAAYAGAAIAPLATLAARHPTQATTDRHTHRLRETIPTHADQILNDPDWPALATTLTDTEAAGHDPARLLHQAADQRALTDARSPAQVLTWRIHRLTQRPTPSPRAQAARTRSTVFREPARRQAPPAARPTPITGADGAQTHRHH